jgi:hypothetical protein
MLIPGDDDEDIWRRTAPTEGVLVTAAITLLLLLLLSGCDEIKTFYEPLLYSFFCRLTK